MKIPPILPAFCLLLTLSCTPKKVDQVDDNKTQIESNDKETSEQPSEPITTDAKLKEVSPANYICYVNDDNPGMIISISFDEDGNALKVKYKDQAESMILSFIKEEHLEGGAYPTIETYYSEMYEDKENGVYKLTHSGNWDYAEYTRGRDEKKFNFTIDHEASIENDSYRTTPCF